MARLPFVEETEGTMIEVGGGLIVSCFRRVVARSGVMVREAAPMRRGVGRDLQRERIVGTSW